VKNTFFPSGPILSVPQRGFYVLLDARSQLRGRRQRITKAACGSGYNFRLSSNQNGARVNYSGRVIRRSPSAVLIKNSFLMRLMFRVKILLTQTMTRIKIISRRSKYGLFSVPAIPAWQFLNCMHIAMDEGQYSRPRIPLFDFSVDFLELQWNCGLGNDSERSFSEARSKKAA
jgi:hypothetical protein